MVLLYSLQQKRLQKYFFMFLNYFIDIDIDTQNRILKITKLKLTKILQNKEYLRIFDIYEIEWKDYFMLW